MTDNEKVREILVDNFGCKNAFCPKCKIRNIDKCPQIDQALSDLHSLWKEKVEKALPKEKQGIMHKEYPMENGSQFSPIDNQKVGFNECLSQVKEALNKI